jgi:diamine N-acetyltransferase
MTFAIRPAIEADHAQLCDLFDELDEQHRIACPDVFRKPAGDARSRDDLAVLIRGEGGVILVAEGPAGLAGLAVAILTGTPTNPLLVSRRILEIENIVVQRAFRRRGIGRSLIGACFEWARQHGADDVEVVVHDFNHEAMRFYAALGFRMSLHRMRQRIA